jgi:hypothetical protein
VDTLLLEPTRRADVAARQRPARVLPKTTAAGRAFSGRHARGAALVFAALAAGALAGDPAVASGALCTPAQRVMFHCTLGDKRVSLCADTAGEAIEALEFRYGKPGDVELSHAAHSPDGRRFAATVSAIAPRVQVRQVWFTSGQVTHLLSECVGRGCSRPGGYSVLRGGTVLSHETCTRATDDTHRFSPALAQFGRDADSSRSNTPLLVFRNVEFGIESMYPPR